MLIFYLNHCLWDVDECTGVLPHDTRLECLFLLFLSLFFMVGHVFPSLFSSLFCTIFWGWGASLALTKISNSLYFRIQASHQMCAERKECIPNRKWQLLVDIYVYFFFFFFFRVRSKKEEKLILRKQIIVRFNFKIRFIECFCREGI